MPRLALPQNYIVNKGIRLADFEDINDWTIAGGSAEEDISHYRTGTKSLKLSTTNDIVTAIKPVSLCLANITMFRLWVHLHTDQDTAWEYRLEFSSDGFASKFVRATFDGNNTSWPNGWFYLCAHRDDFVSFYGESLNNTMNAMRVGMGSHNDKTMTASYDDLCYSVETLPRLIISFDDEYKDDIGGGETPQDYMQNRGLTGTIYTIKSMVGQSGRLSLSELQALYAAGWAIGNHTENHILLDTLSQAEVECEVKNCADWLVSNNMPRAAYHVCYPGGAFNDITLVALAAQNMLTARTLMPTFQTAPIGEYYRLRARMVANTTSLATAKGWIEEAVKHEASFHLCFHRIVESPSIATEWSIDNFKTLINYIVARKIPCVTIDEWYRGLTNPRYKSLPL